MKSKVCAFFLVLIAASGAFAALTEFQLFKLDVPEGWTAAEDVASRTVVFTAPGGEAVLTISQKDGEGKSIEEISQKLAEELKGKNLEVRGNTSGSFDFADEKGVGGHIFIGRDGNEYLMMKVVGSHGDLEGMIRSFAEK